MANFKNKRRRHARACGVCHAHKKYERHVRPVGEVRRAAAAEATIHGE